MVTSYQQAKRIQSNRVKANKPGVARAVARFLKREGLVPDAFPYIPLSQHKARLEALKGKNKKQSPQDEKEAIAAAAQAEATKAALALLANN